MAPLRRKGPHLCLRRGERMERIAAGRRPGFMRACPHGSRSPRGETRPGKQRHGVFSRRAVSVRLRRSPSAREASRHAVSQSRGGAWSCAQPVSPPPPASETGTHAGRVRTAGSGPVGSRAVPRQAPVGSGSAPAAPRPHAVVVMYATAQPYRTNTMCIRGCFYFLAVVMR
jgi:hypothetical protein